MKHDERGKNEPRESVRLWRPAGTEGVEMVRAAYLRQSFARHMHEDYGLGVIENGALGFRYRGEELVAAQGMISLVIPGEVHDGHSADSNGWTYRMFYLEPPAMERIAGELAGKGVGLPYFHEGVVEDPAMARLIFDTHRTLESGAAGRLEKETRFLQMVGEFLLRHARPAPRARRIGREHGAVRRVKEYIHDHFNAEISIQDLARAAGLSKFHLIRVFKKETGLSPHAFLMQIRVNRAREGLARGLPIAEAAQETGFCDQSHLGRHFRRIYGITPGQYRNSVL